MGDPAETALMDKANYPATPYTAHKIDAARIGGFELSGQAVLWASRMGICLRANGGEFRNLTEENFRISGEPSSGAAIVRKNVPFSYIERMVFINLYVCSGVKMIFLAQLTGNLKRRKFLWNRVSI